MKPYKFIRNSAEEYRVLHRADKIVLGWVWEDNRGWWYDPIRRGHYVRIGPFRTRNDAATALWQALRIIADSHV